MKTALVTDWIINRGGAEVVIYELEKLLKPTCIYTTIYTDGKHPELKDAKFMTSWLNEIPGASKLWYFLMPLMYTVFENFDLKDYDVVVSSCHVASKSVITLPRTKHICYCHTPTRYMWDEHLLFVRDKRIFGPFKWLAKYMLGKLRVRDFVAAQRVDVFVANSHFVAERIRKFYRRESIVVYPPIQTHKFKVSDKIDDYFFAMGRLVTYKKFDLLVQAFIQNGKKLKIAGKGPELKNLKKLAKGHDNIEILGYITEEDRTRYMSECQAFLWPQVEDFGITLAEAQASGRPAICYDDGSAREIVLDGETGVFFDEPSIESLNEALERFSRMQWDGKKIKKHAEKFSVAEFRKGMERVLEMEAL